MKNTIVPHNSSIDYIDTKETLPHQYDLHLLVRANDEGDINPRESKTLEGFAKALEDESSHAPLFDALRFSEGLEYERTASAGLYSEADLTGFLNPQAPSIRVRLFHEPALNPMSSSSRAGYREVDGAMGGDTVYTARFTTRERLGEETLCVIHDGLSRALSRVREDGGVQ